MPLTHHLAPDAGADTTDAPNAAVDDAADTADADDATVTVIVTTLD